MVANKILMKGKVKIKAKIKLKKILIIILIIIVVLTTMYNIYGIIIRKIYPFEYSEYVLKYSEKYDIESNWIFALIKAESNFNPQVVSSSGAIGLMQVMEDTALEVAENLNIEKVNLKNPEENIMIRY